MYLQNIVLLRNGIQFLPDMKIKKLAQINWLILHNHKLSLQFKNII